MLDITKLGCQIQKISHKPVFFKKIGDQNTSRDEMKKNLIEVLESQGFKIKNKK